MRKKVRISIFEYVDYRFFLTDYFNLQKKIFRGFTFRSFAKKAGLSASLLKDILSKRQNLTIPAMRKYAGAMGLGGKESAYFEALAGFNNAATNGEKNRFFGEMVRLRGRSAVKFLDMQQYEYFSEWYHAVVRELVTHAGLGNDPEAIARCIVPFVSTGKIRKSIALLRELGLVYEDPDGTWHASDKVISSEYEIQSVALKNYHTGMLERAREALENCPSEEREFQGLTISAGRETFNRMKERIRCFTDELLAMAAADRGKAEEVYQINLQMFPFTRKGNQR
ncbi:MAG: TIGR02147 family protein [Chitinispirillaceae bacterium]|nr:TIGR02147 family protein [Chitinispirillaceae bacterium]